MPVPASREYQLLSDTTGVRADLARCKASDGYAYRRIVVILENLLGNSSECERFIDEGWTDEVIEDVSLIRSLQQERVNGMRVKFWEVHAWRMLFLADHKDRRVGLVGIMHRDQDYENDPILWNRIKDAIDRLGFGRY